MKSSNVESGSNELPSSTIGEPFRKKRKVELARDSKSWNVVVDIRMVRSEGLSLDGDTRG